MDTCDLTGLDRDTIRRLPREWQTNGHLNLNHPALRGVTPMTFMEAAKLMGLQKTARRNITYIRERLLGAPGLDWDHIEILSETDATWPPGRPYPTAKLRYFARRWLPAGQVQVYAKRDDKGGKRLLRLHEFLFFAADPEELVRVGKLLKAQRAKTNRKNASKPRPSRRKNPPKDETDSKR